MFSKKIAESLLKNKAVTLHPTEPAQWTSGQLTPIYCNNRKNTFYVKDRKLIVMQLASRIREQYPETEVIAGVANAGTPWGAMVAYEMELPYISARGEEKKHGAKGKIEGEVCPGKKVFVVEDLISTGGSSIKAIDALEQSGFEVIGLGAIFTYEFPKATEILNETIGSAHFALSSYGTLIDVALETEYINHDQYRMLLDWKTDPNKWSSDRGGPEML
ncbi:MAG: orotate phosphoribosyltransferase [Lactobacillaceae bacterium]|jgi:orotate phosphoribosyltransferase|nr:orotate phosphoribosyltransferase [Lactobacillaceae bacterium]